MAGPEPLLTEYRIHHGPKSCDPCGSSIRESVGGKNKVHAYDVCVLCGTACSTEVWQVHRAYVEEEETHFLCLYKNSILLL